MAQAQPANRALPGDLENTVPEDYISTLHLCDQLGRCVAIYPEYWFQLLSTAREYRWVPAGTVAPPVQLDGKGPESETWDGNYDSAKGQIVLRADAERLRFALQDALNAGQLRHYPADWILLFLNFFSRSFAICPDSQDLRAFFRPPRAHDDAAEDACHLSQTKKGGSPSVYAITAFCEPAGRYAQFTAGAVTATQHFLFCPL